MVLVSLSWGCFWLCLCSRLRSCSCSIAVPHRLACPCGHHAGIPRDSIASKFPLSQTFCRRHFGSFANRHDRIHSLEFRWCETMSNVKQKRSMRGGEVSHACSCRRMLCRIENWSSVRLCPTAYSDLSLPSLLDVYTWGRRMRVHGLLLEK